MRSLLHTCTLSSTVHTPLMDRLTRSKPGTSLDMLLPIPLVPAFSSPLKHCLFILYEPKKNIQKEKKKEIGDFQPLRNSSVIAGALLSIKTWPFQHVCSVLGAVGTGEWGGCRGSPQLCGGLTQHTAFLSNFSSPAKVRELPLCPHVLQVQRRGKEDPVNPQITILAVGHQSRDRPTWNGLGKDRAALFHCSPKGTEEILRSTVCGAQTL